MSTLRFFASFGKTAYASQQHLCLRTTTVAATATSTAATLTHGIWNGQSSNAYHTLYTAQNSSYNKWNALNTAFLRHTQCNPFTSTLNIQSNRKRFGKKTVDCAGKSEADRAAIADAELFGEANKLGLFAKFKLMYKKYWYVMIPVHIITSIGWFGGFYYLSKSGVNVPTLLEYLHISEVLIEKVKNSDMGHVAIAYLCYKVATPLRYAVTLGGTTYSIKYLVQAGHIKPMPSKDELMKIYEQKKADLQQKCGDKESAERKDKDNNK